MTRAVLILAAALAAFALSQAYVSRHFQPSEFRGWADRLAADLVPMLDAFRAEWGAPVRVSPADGAIGRNLGPDAGSLHNVDRWGEVLAIDVMPEGMDTPEAIRRAFDIARRVGFTGIGVYPDWQPSPGLHLDVRRDRRPGDPATWGALDRPDGTQGRYVTVAAVFDAIEKRTA